MSNSILFLDLATKFGWCEGEPGGKPIFGSERFAPEGSGSGAVFGGAFKWTFNRCQAFRPRRIVFEAPLDPRHLGPKTTRDTALRLIGLPACVEGAAYLCGVWDVSEARADDIRYFLLAKKVKKAEAKGLVIRKLRELGYDVSDPDAADALAGWLYACSLFAPQTAAATTPLFKNGLPQATDSPAPKAGPDGGWVKTTPRDDKWGGF